MKYISPPLSFSLSVSPSLYLSLPPSLSSNWRCNKGVWGQWFFKVRPHVCLALPFCSRHTCKPNGVVPLCALLTETSGLRSQLDSQRSPIIISAMHVSISLQLHATALASSLNSAPCPCGSLRSQRARCG